jgi:hypothetical protein
MFQWLSNNNKTDQGKETRRRVLERRDARERDLREMKELYFV